MSSSKSRKGFSKWIFRFIRVASICFLIFVAIVCSSGFVLLVTLNRGLPSVDSLKHYEPKIVAQVYSTHGEVIAEFFKERRIVVKDVPRHIRLAFIGAEDAAFYSHKGIDFLSVLRAAYVNLMAGSVRQGASTLTQQVARGFLLTRERTYTRKLKEAILAWQIENALTKDEIIHLYLNQFYLGRGAYGVAAAAKIYFGKKLVDVTIAEAALLAGLPQSPSRYIPAKYPDRAKRRQLYVLKRMLEEEFISLIEYEKAIHEDIYIERPVNLTKTIAPYFSEYVRRYVMREYGSEEILKEGYKIYTTLDVDIQRYARNSLRKGLSNLEKRQGYRGPLQKLSFPDVEEYFRGKKFVEREDETVIGVQDLEVSGQEAKGKGEIRMRPPKNLAKGDWIEGVVHTVDDEKQEALVEYEPGYFARLVLKDMKWATERFRPHDEDQRIKRVRKVSDVLEPGYVILMTIKELSQDPDEPLLAQLEQHTEVQGAVFSMHPKSGQVKAMVGGYDYSLSEFNRALQAKRQPGSAFKPIVYAAALDLGFTPATLLQDSPITFSNSADEKKWRPRNYDGRFIGDIPLRTSLLASRNITTVRLLNEVGIDTAIRYARRLGIESELTRDFTLALGSSVVTLKELLKPYVVFVNGGYPKSAIFIKKIVNRYGQIVEQNVREDLSAPYLDMVDIAVTEFKKEISKVKKQEEKLKEEAPEETVSFLTEVGNEDDKKRQVVTSPLKPGQVLSTETSFLMTYLLKENVLYGTGRRARALKRPASGKTGTTDENRDAWFIGFTPELVSGVWVGFDDLRILGRRETGSRAAVPIWLDFMIQATEPYPKTDYVVPKNIEFARIDPKTGGLATANTKGAIFEAFVKGTAPTKVIRPKSEEINLYQRDE